MDSEAYFGLDIERPAPPLPATCRPTSPWLVFREGTAAPKFQHPSRALAEVEARHLAKLNPGKNFFVLGTVSVTSTPAVPTTRNLA